MTAIISGRPTALLLTALPVEMKAVLAHLSRSGSTQQAGPVLCEIGIFTASDGLSWQVVSAELGPGNLDTASAVVAVTTRFRPDVLMFVGIAGALKDDVNVGDVVAGTEMAWTERGKSSPGGYLPRIRTTSLSAQLVQLARKIAREGSWTRRLDPPRPGAKAIAGQIASGEKVVADDGYRAWLCDTFSDAIAIETEGFALARAGEVYADGQRYVVRGISDYADGSKSDHGQEDAAEAAAAFAFELLDAYSATKATILSAGSPGASTARIDRAEPPLGREAGADADLPALRESAREADVTGDAGNAAAARDQLAALRPVVEGILGAEHSETLAIRGRLAHWTGEAGDPATARRQGEEILPAFERIFGPSGRATLALRADLASMTRLAGSRADALDQYTGLLPLFQRIFGPEHPATLDLRAKLAHSTGEAGNGVGARDQFVALLPLLERVLGRDHPNTLNVCAGLVRWTASKSNPAEARDQFVALLPAFVRVRGPEHPETLYIRHSIARWTGSAGDPAEARAQYAELLPIRERVLGPKHRDTATTRSNLNYWTGKADEASRAHMSDRPAGPRTGTDLAELRAGDTFAGRYVIQRELGEGDRKKTYLAQDTKLDRPVALSFVKPDAALADPDGTEREAKVLGRIGSHDNIVSLYDYEISPDGSAQYMIFEYLSGGTLTAYLRDAGPLPGEAVLRLGRQLCRGLAHLHDRGLIHRDISPDNIWLDERRVAHLGDFDSAITAGSQTGLPITTGSFASPEELAGEHLDQRADLYSLGLVLHVAATAERFPGDLGLLSARVDLPSSFSDLLASMLAASPADRPRDADSVLQLLKTTQRASNPSALIAAGESDVLEFKASLHHPYGPLPEDLRSKVGKGAVTEADAWKIVRKRLNKAVTRTLAAFLNSHGGTLLIGVSDSGEIVGIQADFPYLRKDKQDTDGWQLSLREVVTSALGPETLDVIHVSLVQHEQAIIAVVQCPRRSSETWHQEGGGEQHFYTRALSASHELTGSSLSRHIREHWSS